MCDGRMNTKPIEELEAQITLLQSIKSHAVELLKENTALRERVRGLEGILLDIRTHARTVNNGLSYNPTNLIDKPELDKLLEGNQ